MVKVIRGHVDGHAAGSVLEYDADVEARLVAMGLCEPCDGAAGDAPGPGEPPEDKGGGKEPSAKAATKAELIEQAEELGVKVPKGATKDQIGALIDEALLEDGEPPAIEPEVPR